MEIDQVETLLEIGDLIDAELHETSEVLSARAQHVEDRWPEETPPAFIAEFITRHLRQPPWREIAEAGPAPLSVPETVDRVALDAARLALLMMRGALAMRGRQTRGDVYLVAPPGRALSPADAVVALATMPKPVRCRAVVRDGYMAVTCGSITEAPEFPTSSRSRGSVAHDMDTPRGWRHIDLMSATRGSHRAYFLGVDESMIVGKETFDRMFIDYELMPFRGGGAEPTWFLASHPAAAREAHANGVTFMVQCGPDNWTLQQAGQAIQIDTDAGRVEAVLHHVPEGLGLCQRCQTRSADWEVTDVREPQWQRQAICTGCAIVLVESMARRDVSEVLRLLEEQRDENSGSRLRRVANRLERSWRVLPPPQFVRDALTQYRQRS